jgi:MOB kinase activator 1
MLGANTKFVLCGVTITPIPKASFLWSTQTTASVSIPFCFNEARAIRQIKLNNMATKLFGGLAKGKSGTVKKKQVKEGDKHYQLAKYAEASLGSGDLKKAVKCPEGEDINEWLAYNVIDFFNQIHMLYGTIAEFCTDKTCPTMSAGPKYEYHWADGVEIKKAIKCSAPEYVDYLMEWIQKQVDDEKIFPSQVGVPFPKNFRDVVKNIMKRLFRVYAHIYLEHFKHIEQLQAEAHLNTSFKHFIYFVQEHDLVPEKELVPLADLIKSMKSRDEK